MLRLSSAGASRLLPPGGAAAPVPCLGCGEGPACAFALPHGLSVRRVAWHPASQQHLLLLLSDGRLRLLSVPRGSTSSDGGGGAPASHSRCALEQEASLPCIGPHAASYVDFAFFPPPADGWEALSLLLLSSSGSIHVLCPSLQPFGGHVASRTVAACEAAAAAAEADEEGPWEEGAAAGEWLAAALPPPQAAQAPPPPPPPHRPLFPATPPHAGGARRDTPSRRPLAPPLHTPPPQHHHQPAPSPAAAAGRAAAAAAASSLRCVAPHAPRLVGCVSAAIRPAVAQSPSPRRAGAAASPPLVARCFAAVTLSPTHPRAVAVCVAFTPQHTLPPTLPAPSSPLPSSATLAISLLLPSSSDTSPASLATPSLRCAENLSIDGADASAPVSCRFASPSSPHPPPGIVAVKIDTLHCGQPRDGSGSAPPPPPLILWDPPPGTCLFASHAGRIVCASLDWVPPACASLSHSAALASNVGTTPRSAPPPAPPPPPPRPLPLSRLEALADSSEVFGGAALLLRPWGGGGAQCLAVAASGALALLEPQPLTACAGGGDDARGTGELAEEERDDATVRVAWTTAFRPSLSI